jgi:hypothetical protein
MKKLPIGIQSIRKILSNNEYVYVDKTSFIKQLIDEGSPHYFLSRPRRFGKSLFINTLEEVFSGNKDLFKGFQIYESDYSWEEHPVVHIDFSKIANRSPEKLETAIKTKLEIIARKNNVSIITNDVEGALDTLITELSENKNSKVVVLIDEYDKPIIDQIENPEISRANKDILKGFFGVLKGLDDNLKFTFTTGVSKFAQVSLFSGLNNLRDITMTPEFSGMMGYTEEEIKKYFSEHLKALKTYNNKEEEVLETLRYWYNGYRFSESSTCVYNPFSTLSFLKDKKVKPYWYRTGTPSFLVDQLKKYSTSMIPIDGTTATEEELLDINSIEEIDVKALMYQTGYFTIKEYNPTSKRYHLGLPNEEVRSAFINSLVKNFASIINVKASEKFVKALQDYEINLLFQHLSQGFASFAYQVFSEAKERTYQGMLLSMLYGMGFDPISEKSTNLGRIDVALELPKITYILELKLDSNPEKALDQIRKKEYFKPYTHKGKEIAIVGASFSSEKRNISDWKGEILSENGELIKTLKPEKFPFENY